jgi:hypothetical protein
MISKDRFHPDIQFHSPGTASSRPKAYFFSEN